MEQYTERVYTFDFCYLYFRRGKDYVLANMEQSCNALWAFLSSWGMMRNATLMGRNPAALKGVIEAVVADDLSDLDLADYSSAEARRRVIDGYNRISGALKVALGGKTPTLTLVTKVMLGTYSCIPAFDTRFCAYYKRCFGKSCRTIDDAVLLNLAELKDSAVPQESVIDGSVFLFDFDGTHSDVRYKQAKLLDLYGWRQGGDSQAQS